MGEAPTGKAFIIINKQFKTYKTKDRGGAEIDKQCLEKVIDRLGFKWINTVEEDYLNISKEKFAHTLNLFNNCSCLQCQILSEDYSNLDYFLFAISSHGKEIDGCVNIKLTDELVPLSKIISILNDDRLKNTVKILIIQVCRADQSNKDEHNDHAVDVNILETSKHSEDEARGDDEDHDSDGEDWDGTGDENDDDSDTSSESETDDDMVMDDEDMGDEDIPLPLNIAIPPNFILIFPTWSGRKAKRSPKKGSWMISALSEVVMEHNFAAGRMDFLQALTKVSEKVARRETKVKKDRTTKKEKKKGEKTSGGRQDDGNNMDGQRKKGRKAKPGQKNTVTVVHRLLKPILI